MSLAPEHDARARERHKSGEKDTEKRPRIPSLEMDSSGLSEEENGAPSLGMGSKRSRVQPIAPAPASAPTVDIPAPPIERPAKIGVYLEKIDQRRLLVLTVAKYLHDERIQMSNIYSKGYSQVLVLFPTMPAANRLLNHPTILDTLKCKATLSSPQSNLKGIIRGIDVDFPEADLKKELHRNGHKDIIKVIRIMRQEGQISTNKVPTASVILEFSGKVLPERVSLYNVKRDVDVFVGKPRVCYKCLKFGHTAKQCKSSTTFCSFCGLNHKTEDCPKDKKTDTPCCVNCQGNHVPMSLDCKILQDHFAVRMQETLKTTLFQRHPNINSNTDFPPPPGDAAQEQPSTEPPCLPPPKLLPPAVQKKRVQRFSEVLASKQRTPEQILEKRHHRYKPIPTPPKNYPPYMTSMAHSLPVRPPMPRTQRPRAPPPSRPPPANAENLTDSQMEAGIINMLSNTRVLTLIITILHALNNITRLPSTTPVTNDILSVQQEILRIIALHQQLSTPSDHQHLQTQSPTEHPQHQSPNLEIPILPMDTNDGQQ